MIDEDVIKNLIREYHPNSSEEELQRLSKKVTNLLIIDAYNLIRTLD